MEHKDLDHWVELGLRMSDSSKLIYSTVIDGTKTAITKSSYNGDMWIYQSSINVDGFETGVDVVRLTSDIVEVIKNK